MDETQVYQGHAIRLAIRKLSCDRFEWTYFIDASYCFQSPQSLPGEALARNDALVHAHRSVDRLLAMRPPLASEAMTPRHPGASFPTR